MLSGTSYDAVDAAVGEIAFAGPDLVLRPLGLHTEPYPAGLRAELTACLPPAATTLEAVCRLDTGLGRFFGEVAARADQALAGGHADLVVSHGQTVYHWVADGHALGTLQLGGAAWIAEATGLPVVSDLRTRDIARGGQGAPLAAMLDSLLLLGGNGDGNGGVVRGALNLGGIANITVAGPGGEVLAYDLGPANALIDAAVTEATGGAERMDTDGARAARGRVDRELLAGLLAEPYYRLPPPKSTGKELFHAAYLRDRLAELDRRPSADDLVATLTELTAELVAAACRTHGLSELVVSGGGVRNPALMDRLGALAAPVRLVRPEKFGLPAQAKEAYLFALLGFLTVHGLAGAIPSATGARSGAVLGSLTPGAGPLRLPEPHPGPPPRRLVIER
ncbi:anhydro-N-acetylmuramic acid kinase [Streptomyces litchfieldiae]|uniref:Anhydro-N-acetylmuramic acid kinase n=1 Tax=Streptomyces litchfieldiae TaxID=3075543 RepID=A0ABU2MTA9_9ACTN|nr:anhydro-N-acetylmuramic acid kinase [Streptomyces sp. DSM 44938]MDT0344309.1 anhydro-N-acetylmuramic acid kinase [Streptomyces sp. DSM 44938]